MDTTPTDLAALTAVLPRELVDEMRTQVTQSLLAKLYERVFPGRKGR